MSTWSPYLDKEYDPLMAGSIDGTDTVPHDQAICRAMVAKYKPNKLVKGDPKLTIFVGKLSPTTTEETLYSAFRKFGKIRHVRLVRDVVTGFSKCYAFVEFESEKSVRHAFSEGKKMTIDDKQILVDHEHERILKNWVPRRLGGGFGGKKESGQLRFGCIDRPFRRPITPMIPISSSKSRPGSSNSRSDSFGENHRRDYDRRRQEGYSHRSGSFSRNSFSDSSRHGDEKSTDCSRSPRGSSDHYYKR